MFDDEGLFVIQRERTDEIRVFKSYIDGRRKLNWREKILTALSSQYWYGPMILEAIDVEKS